jgi:diaminopimelate decarboxylase
LAKAIARETWISLRVNPDIDAKTHPKISTGLKDTKFGVPAVDFEKSCLFIKKSGWLKIVGLSCHIGSQIAETGPIFAATKKMAAMVKSLLDLGFSDIKYLDMGGGFGIRYRDENPAPLIECAEGMSEIMKDLPVKLYLEPGRVLVGNSAILLTRVIDIKAAETKSFIVVDASMSELMRPSLYDAYHEIVPVQKRAGLPTQRKEGELHSGIFDVVGPVCESADVLGVNRKFEHIAVGDLLAIRTAGAYGMSMASNYNSRPRPCEVLVDGSTSKLVRRREGFSDLVAHEIFEP